MTPEAVAYVWLGVYVLWTAVFALLAVVMARLLRPNRPSPVKLATYESGLLTKGETWVRFKIGYYQYALAFVIFDLETLFLYPWAVAFRSLGGFAAWEALLFVVTLLLGLGYAWREGALEWK
ncbi:MAG: NADH-quinone oxidoreductase subunit A [Betaproteobacteria bacterium]